MFVAEEKLAIEVREIDGVQVHYVNLAKACKREVLEQFTPNATSANHKYTRLTD
jgi:hypothetical protein